MPCVRIHSTKAEQRQGQAIAGEIKYYHRMETSKNASPTCKSPTPQPLNLPKWPLQMKASICWYSMIPVLLLHITYMPLSEPAPTSLLVSGPVTQVKSRHKPAWHCWAWKRGKATASQEAAEPGWQVPVSAEGSMAGIREGAFKGARMKRLNKGSYLNYLVYQLFPPINLLTHLNSSWKPLRRPNQYRIALKLNFIFWVFPFPSKVLFPWAFLTHLSHATHLGVYFMGN